MPKDRLGQVARAAVVQEEGVAADLTGKADPPQRRRAPLRAGSVADLLAIGQAGAHVVQQKVGIGPDQLERLRLVRGVAAGDEFRRVTGDAAERVKMRFAGKHIRVADIAACRHRQVLGIEGHEIHDRGRRLAVAEALLNPDRQREAGGFRRGTIAPGFVHLRRRDAEVIGERFRRLLADGGG